jgi:hypothetical protein
MTTMTTKPGCHQMTLGSTTGAAQCQATDRSMRVDLPDGEHRDRCRLGQDVAGVAGREEHRRQECHGDDEGEQHQDRAETDHGERDTQQSEVALLPLVGGVWGLVVRGGRCARYLGVDRRGIGVAADCLAADTRQVGHRVVPPGTVPHASPDGDAGMYSKRSNIGCLVPDV